MSNAQRTGFFVVRIWLLVVRGQSKTLTLLEDTRAGKGSQPDSGCLSAETTRPAHFLRSNVIWHASHAMDMRGRKIKDRGYESIDDANRKEPGYSGLLRSGLERPGCAPGRDLCRWLFLVHAAAL